MNEALRKIRVWRAVIEHDAVENGLKRPSGRQNEGYESYRPSAALAMSRLGECTVYSGPRLPVNPTYLTVECHIAQLRFSDKPDEDRAAREEFKRFVFKDLKSMGTFNRKLAKHHLEASRLLLESLSLPDLVKYN